MAVLSCLYNCLFLCSVFVAMTRFLAGLMDAAQQQIMCDYDEEADGMHAGIRFIIFLIRRMKVI